MISKERMQQPSMQMTSKEYVIYLECTSNCITNVIERSCKCIKALAKCRIVCFSVALSSLVWLIKQK